MRSTSKFRFNAPRGLGAFLFLASLAFTTGCDQKARTPDWQASEDAIVEPIGKVTGSLPRGAVDITDTVRPATPLRFLSYNLRNWVTAVDTSSSKPEKEKEAVIDMIAMARPDVLGISEIGAEPDMNELRNRLMAVDIDLPHTLHVRGTDPERHLAFLSRYPIVATGKAKRANYRLNGTTHGILRGILDVTIQTEVEKYRFVGVHLKSKRDVAGTSQDEMRQHEANLVRLHIDEILSADPTMRLVVYGDFNDTRGSATLRTLRGSPDASRILRPVPLHDRFGETWTQRWIAEDVYSRFDWVLVTQSLERHVNQRESRILDEPRWKDASDHRPLLVLFE